MSDETMFETMETAVRSLCTDATRAAFREVDTEDLPKRLSQAELKQIAAPSPAEANYGDWTAPATLTRAGIMTKLSERYLAQTPGKDVSLVHNSVDCPPHEEDAELRLKYAERVAQWRTLFTSVSRTKNIHEYETDPSIHAYMKYRYTGSLVDLACPRNASKTRWVKSLGDVKQVSLSDIDLKMEDVAKVAEVTEVMENMDVTEATKSTNEKKKEGKSKFLCCFGRK